MLNKFLPQRIDNAYSGHRLALWIFALVVSVKILATRSLSCSHSWRWSFWPHS